MELTLCGTQRDAWEQAPSCTLLDCQHPERGRTQRGSSMRDLILGGHNCPWRGTTEMSRRGRQIRGVPGSVCLGGSLVPIPLLDLG